MTQTEETWVNIIMRLVELKKTHAMEFKRWSKDWVETSDVSDAMNLDATAWYNTSTDETVRTLEEVYERFIQL